MTETKLWHIAPGTKESAKPMDRALRRKSVFVLASVFLFVFWAFWPNYFSRLFDQSSWRFHFHGLTMMSWCALMITQAYLIRVNNRAAHRATGKASYVIVPLIVVSTLLLAHYQNSPNGLTEAMLYFTALPIALLLQFLVPYGLAIHHRKNPPVHARFMVCTALPLIPAISDRIMGSYLLPPARAQFLPQIGGAPQYWLISWAVVDTVLILLSIWDWRSRRCLNVFPVILVAFIILEGLTMTIYSTPVWRSFTGWFFSLPLS